jgi:hypothetical protein
MLRRHYGIEVDAAERDVMRRKILEVNSVLHDDVEGVRDLNRFLCEVMEGAPA